MAASIEDYASSNGEETSSEGGDDVDRIRSMRSTILTLRGIWFPVAALGFASGVVGDSFSFMGTDYFASKYSHALLHCESPSSLNYASKEDCMKGRMDDQSLTSCLGCMSSVMSALLSPVIGALSDHFGRKRILATTTALHMMPHIGGLCYMYLGLPFPVDIALQLFGSLPDSSVWFTYATDLLPPAELATGFGLMTACGYIASFLGGLTSTLVLKSMKARYTVGFVFFAGRCLYTVLGLPETTPPGKGKEKRPFDYRKIIPVMGCGVLCKMPAARLVMFLSTLATANFVGLVPVVNARLMGFGQEKFIMLKNVELASSFVLLAFGIRKLKAVLGEAGSFIVAIISSGLWLLFSSFLTEYWQVVCLWALLLGPLHAAEPVASGILSKMCDENEKGELFGTMTGALALASFVGLFLYAAVESWLRGTSLLNHFPGLVIMIGAISSFLSIPAMPLLPRMLDGSTAEDGEE